MARCGLVGGRAVDPVVGSGHLVRPYGDTGV